MSDLSLEPLQLQDYLPHRGPNLLPDEVVIKAGGVASESRTCIGDADRRGRDGFARRAPDGTPCWSEPFLVELMALTGVPLLRDQLGEGRTAVFSMVSRIAFNRLVPLGVPVIGKATITRNRGAFTVFATEALVDGEVVLAAEVMSGSATLAEVAGQPVRPPQETHPPLTDDTLDFKPEHLRFVHGIVEEDAGAGRLVASYTYPEDHFCVPGHFPGAPLMMGMCQWSAVADAGLVAARRFGLSGTVAVQGSIARPDGSEVLDVRECTLDTDEQRILATKRLAFREPVRPGDGLLTTVTVRAC